MATFDQGLSEVLGFWSASGHFDSGQSGGGTFLIVLEIRLILRVYVSQLGPSIRDSYLLLICGA